jgi:hypothetical protein
VVIVVRELLTVVKAMEVAARVVVTE